MTIYVRPGTRSFLAYDRLIGWMNIHAPNMRMRGLSINVELDDRLLHKFKQDFDL